VGASVNLYAVRGNWTVEGPEPYAGALAASIDDVLDEPIPAGARFELPSLRLKSTLGFREFELAGTSVAEYLDALIVSSDLRQRVTDDLLLRINRGRQLDVNLRQDALLSVRRGTLILPYQTWSVSTSKVRHRPWGTSAPATPVSITSASRSTPSRPPTRITCRRRPASCPRRHARR